MAGYSGWLIIGLMVSWCFMKTPFWHHNALGICSCPRHDVRSMKIGHVATFGKIEVAMMLIRINESMNEWMNAGRHEWMWWNGMEWNGTEWMDKQHQQHQEYKQQLQSSWWALILVLLLPPCPGGVGLEQAVLKSTNASRWELRKISSNLNKPECTLQYFYCTLW